MAHNSEHGILVPGDFHTLLSTRIKCEIRDQGKLALATGAEWWRVRGRTTVILTSGDEAVGIGMTDKSVREIMNVERGITIALVRAFRHMAIPRVF